MAWLYVPQKIEPLTGSPSSPESVASNSEWSWRSIRAHCESSALSSRTRRPPIGSARGSAARSGTTCTPSIPNPGPQTSSPVAFPVSLSAERPVGATHTPTCGPPRCELSGQYALPWSCSRTWSVTTVPPLTSPIWVTPSPTPSSPLPRWARHTFVDGGSAWVSTPTATGNQLSPSMQKWPGCRNLTALCTNHGTTLPQTYEWLMGFPTGWLSPRPSATAWSRWWRLMRSALSRLG